MISRFARLAFCGLAFQFCTSLALAQPPSMVPAPGPITPGGSVRVVPNPEQQYLLEQADPALAANKRLVYAMWRTIMNAGQIEQAERFFSPDYIEHDPSVLPGLTAMLERVSASVPRQAIVPPTIEDPLVTMIADGNYVVLAFVSQYPEPDGSDRTYTSTRFDLFRLANGKIAEHWDSLQRRKGATIPMPGQPGGPAPVLGTAGVGQLSLLTHPDQSLANNKRLMFDTWRHIPDAGREEFADIYLEPTYIQHNPNAVTGRDGFKEYFSRRADKPIEAFLEDELIVAMAEGDVVIQSVQEERPNPDKPDEIYYVAWFDMFRVSNGRLAEHWDTAAKGELPAVMQE